MLNGADFYGVNSVSFLLWFQVRLHAKFSVDLGILIYQQVVLVSRSGMYHFRKKKPGFARELQVKQAVNVAFRNCIIFTACNHVNIVGLMIREIWILFPLM